MKASRPRKTALAGYAVPSPQVVFGSLCAASVATVENTRALILEELEALQQWLRDAETDPLVVFWPGGVRVVADPKQQRHT